MKTGLCLLLFAAAATAQPNQHDALVARLITDLMPLSFDDQIIQIRSMNQFANDLNGFYHPRGPVTRNLAYTLTSVLAGKDLSDDRLTPLMNGILACFDAAYALRPTATDPLKSARFRASIERSYASLTKLGVGDSEAQGVMRLLYQAANRIARPIFRPIPPGVRHRSGGQAARRPSQ